MKPLVSIITPCYNSKDYIAATIQSVLDQQYSNWELIVIDDQSKDNSLAIVQTYAKDNPKLKIIALEQNGGVANARNVGVSAATGKYIAFLDSDDIWLPEKLKKQVEFMETHQVPMTFLSYQRINEDGKIISGKINMPETVNYNKLLWHNIVIFSTSMVLRSVAQDIKFKKMGHEDWIYWLDLFKKCGQGYGVNEVLAHYRIRGGSVSSNKFVAINSTWKILRESEKIGLIKSMYLFTRYAFATVWKRLK